MKVSWRRVATGVAVGALALAAGLAGAVGSVHYVAELRRREQAAFIAGQTAGALRALEWVEAHRAEVCRPPGSRT